MLPLEIRFVLGKALDCSSIPASRAWLAAGRPTLPASFRFSRHQSSTASSHRKAITVLGLESSADDSCAAVVTLEPDGTRRIRSNIVLKQGAVHEAFGGIHPLHAQEAHQANMPVAIRAALDQASLTLAQLDAIAFTRGPGMFGCLSVCAQSAKALAAAQNLPLLGVHHMQAHALTPQLTEAIPPKFPFLTLLLSGGHTLLLLARGEYSFEILATTHDESIGASFDKACRDLAIPWNLHPSGAPGAALEVFADLPSAPHPPSSGPFPLPFRGKLAFSYAGLRSELSRILVAEPVETMGHERKRELARSFIVASVQQVEEKVKLAMKKLEAEEGSTGTMQALVCSGGVASNQFLRLRLRRLLDTMGHETMSMVFPPPHLCTDNAAMIASLGCSRFLRGRIDPLSVRQQAKWSIEECEADFA